MIQTQRGLTLEAYSSGTTPIVDPRGELQWAEGLGFSTGYPGGDLEGSFTVPRDIVAWWEINGAKRIAFRQGQRIVYEGYVGGLDRLLDEQRQAIKVPCVGGWAHILMNRRWRKYWADNRIDDKTWFIASSAHDVNDKTLTEIMSVDRNSRLRFTPKNVAFTQFWYGCVEYKAPTGDTVKRITFDYDIQEAAQAWRLGLYNVGTGGTIWSVTASGTGSADHTLVTPSQRIFIYFQAEATQTPPSDGTIYGQVSNVVVYTETGAINATEIAKDIIGHFTELNADTTRVGSNTLSLVPFLAEWDELAADIITKAVSFGDVSANRWAAFMLNSENAQMPDGKPILGIEQYPLLTDHDLVLRLDGDNVAGQVQISQNFDDIWNWIIVEYQDENGWTKWITPDDDATLKDTASITLYGQRDSPSLKVGQSTATVATANGKRYLAAYKDPQWNISPIGVIDHIDKKAGNPILTAQIRAGQRLKIENFMQDLSGTGLTLLITSTNYEDESGICKMTFGKPESPLLTVLERELQERPGTRMKFGGEK